MTKVIADDDDKCVALDSWPEGARDGVEVSIANEGEDLSLEIVYPFNLDTANSDRLAQRAIGEPSNTEVFTKRNAQGDWIIFRDFVNGQPNPAGDKAFLLSKERGTHLYLLRREGGKPYEQPFEVGDEVSIWEVEVDQMQTPKDEGYRRAQAPLAVKRHHKPIYILEDAA